ncbi:glycosyl transferase [Cokeromyces recurvatus]|uniref:glycosyl transferase n=1 Tax=Cokeromyces recurvatus TaxID=90255 RepID=UPI00221FA0A9|nr:glycosyl transferase [Cokeromyces recurvatus]KAI7905704.1 glycosyl transferase [Cokeromyces recurvatus]
MTYKNRPIIRILLVSFILITSIYTFIQIFYFNHTTNTLKQSSSRFEDDYFYYSNSVWQHTNPTHLNYPHNRFKAAFYTFVKSDRTSLTKLRSTIRNLEDQFNKKYHYPYIIFSNEDLNEEFRELTSSIVADSSTTIRFEKVNDDLYGYGPNTDLKKAEKARNTLSDIMFGDNEDYRFQSRFMAGTIYRHPLMQELDYGWRFEAGTEYICPINEDPFQFMFENNKTTSFSMALYEYRETVPTLYQTVLDYAKDHIHWIQPFGDSNNLWHFILNENNKFNYCHFWNNFQ